MASSLESLVRGSEPADRILLQDSVEQSGRLLLKCFVCHCMHRYSAVHVFLFDAHPSGWLRGLPAGVQERLNIHDGFSDPLGWNGSPGAVLATSGVESYLKTVGVASSEAVGVASNGTVGVASSEVVVVVDSLSTLLLNQSVAQVCRLLHQLARHSSILIGLLHGDMHEDHVISQLSHVMSTNIQVKSVEPELATEYHGKSSVTHQKKSGKVITKAEWYSIAGDWSITSTEAAAVATHSEHSGAEEHPDPAANLTFNLSLSAREREARAKVVLPYTYNTRKKVEHLQVGAGRIFYQPDDADDFDESDPDDDLDI